MGPSSKISRTAGRAGVIAVAALIVSACGNGEDSGVEPVADPAAVAAARADTAATATTTKLADDESGSIDPLDIVGEIINQFDLVNGDCFNRVEGTRSGRKVVTTSRLDCDEPHMAEVFHTFELDTPHPAFYPDPRTLEDLALSSCYNRFESFVGQLYELSVLEISIFIPNRENFEDETARYRGVHCWLYHSNAEPLEGSVRGRGI